MIWWEDFKVGDSVEMGRHSFSAQEIVDFGRRFDPQPFHVDAAAAETGFFGGLIASGWHTCSVAMRVMVESYLKHAASLGSPGIDELRWLRPAELSRLRTTEGLAEIVAAAFARMEAS